jgi:hypothetical protein
LGGVKTPPFFPWASSGLELREESKKGGIMRFISDHANHRIVIEPRRKIMIEGEIVRTDGKAAQFENGVFETNDKKIADWLLNYERCGKDYFPDVSQEQLWELEAKEKKVESETQTVQEEKPKFKISRGRRKKE